MKLKFLAALGLVAASWSLSAAATSYSVVCNGCTTAQTLAVVQGSAYGDHFVYDMLNRKITHYSVLQGKDIDHQAITNVPITSAVQTQFNTVQQLFDVSGTLDIELAYSDTTATKAASVNTLHTAAVVSVPLVAAESTAAGASLSAFDVINTPANQTAAINAMKSQSAWANASLVLRTALASFTSHFAVTQTLYPVPTTISVTLKFNDETTCKVTWNVDTDQWEYVPGSSRDSVGNPIPENPDQAVGGAANRQNYVFADTPNGVSSALSQWQNFKNIGLPVGVPVFDEGSTWTVACVRVGGLGGSVTCTVIPT